MYWLGELSLHDELERWVDWLFLPTTMEPDTEVAEERMRAISNAIMDLLRMGRIEDVERCATRLALLQAKVRKVVPTGPKLFCGYYELRRTQRLGPSQLGGPPGAGPLSTFTSKPTIEQPSTVTDNALDTELVRLLGRAGDAATGRGNLEQAARLFAESLAIAKRLAQSDPANAQWQRDLSISYNKLGDPSTARPERSRTPPGRKPQHP